MEEDPATQEGAIAKFQTLSAEGDLLLQKGTLHSAIAVFTKALEIKPTDKHCLVQRSRCYIQIGAAQEALNDANESLKDNDQYHKGLYLKAEALYCQGNFENALLFFHRGNKLRPELNEFRVGILKCREAINNSIGDPKKLKINVPAKLRKTLLQMGEYRDKTSLLTAGNLSGHMQGKLLEELYDDKVYLQQFLSDRDFIDFPDPAINGLVSDGLEYLTKRAGFWRQQNPIYARPKSTKIIPRLQKIPEKAS